LLNKDTGRLVSHFIAVANNQVKDMTLIREGNERVLAARLADAKFFFDEDRKIRLDERVKKLSGVTFHQKLGTMAQKTERVKALAAKLAEFRQDNELVENCSRAAHLSKADLLTGIVGEFPELQGVMGGEYAKHDGEPEAVSMAIREQYLPRTIEGELPKTLPGKILSLADRLDTIVAFFHVGIVPTGSEDPFALRRHATAFVRILVDMDWRLDLDEWVTSAQDLLKKQGVSVVGNLSGSKKATLDNPVSFIVERLRFYGRTIQGLRDDVMEAVLKSVDQTNKLDIVDVLNKMKALQSMTDRPEFDPLMVGFKRAHRLVEKERWERKPIETSIFHHSAESELYKLAEENNHRFITMVRQSDYQPALEILVQMKPSIDSFFEAVMVNADDPAVRSNRLSLLKQVDDLFMSFADFSQIVVQGG
jgi:glycyl-tRNA synthetase beta chain